MFSKNEQGDRRLHLVQNVLKIVIGISSYNLSNNKQFEMLSCCSIKTNYNAYRHLVIYKHLSNK